MEFDDSCQRALAGFIEEIDALGAHIILSNSDPKNVDEDDDFFEDLYANYDIQRIYAKRKINSVAEHRGYITELLIKNY
jgi:DNA adenine methylase